MRYSAVKGGGSAQGGDRLEELTTQIGRLLRHRCYQREKVVSPMLRRHLPYDSGYAWQGEATLRERIKQAGLDAKSIDHLIVSVRAEFERIMARMSA